MTADLALAAERVRIMQEELEKDAKLAVQWAAHRRARRPPFRPNREELAWAAGFFDGEGSTHVASRFYERSDGVTKGPYLQLQLSIVQVGEWCLIRFMQAVGDLGAIYAEKDRDGCQPRHRWQVGSFEDCQAVLAMLWPFWTSPKRAQAASCLEVMHEYHQAHPRPPWQRRYP